MAVSLREWQKAVLPALRECSFTKASDRLQDVTLLAYFFWDDHRIESEFFALECAFLCAFRCFGLMPAVLVLNKTTKRIDDFCKRYSVEKQIDSSLTGDIKRMSIDCISNLHKRFKTDWVLIIQTDGIPVNPGLERFVGEYDYYGAPWPGHADYFDWFPYPKYGVGNGGFSLRSKQICMQASKSYEAFWRLLPYYWRIHGDDTFYCKTLPFFNPSWKRRFRYPSIKEAALFAIDSICSESNTEIPPIGFHSENGFHNYVKRYGVPMREFLP